MLTVSIVKHSRHTLLLYEWSLLKAFNSATEFLDCQEKDVNVRAVKTHRADFPVWERGGVKLHSTTPSSYPRGWCVYTQGQIISAHCSCDPSLLAVSICLNSRSRLWVRKQKYKKKKKRKKKKRSTLWNKSSVGVCLPWVGWNQWEWLPWVGGWGMKSKTLFPASINPSPPPHLNYLSPQAH